MILAKTSGLTGWCRCLCSLVLWLVLAMPAVATPTVDLGAGDRVVSLEREWAFQPGDDPSWAAPDFDDSAWPLLHVPGAWGR
ncbi:MAG: hypothetical protein KDD11_23280, partial [Acidobacteria bacterium]|nr:hypothetical protein [Acidobacteriota bacterium]